MPTTNEQFAEDIRDAIKAAMESDPYYEGISIVTERLQDLDAKVDEIIKLTDGIVVILAVVTLGDPLPDLPGANFDNVQIAASTIENLNLNASGKTAMQISIHTAALWSQMPLPELAANLKLESVALGVDPRGVNYITTATTKAGTRLEIPRLDEPTSYVQPFGATPVETFNDGTRAYTWRAGNGRLVLEGVEPSAPNNWLLDIIPPSEGINASATFSELVDDSLAGHWTFARLAGTWTLVEDNPEGSLSVAPVVPAGYEFFSDSLVSLAPADSNPAAMIFQTSNGSAPIPRNPAASIYSTALVATSGVTIRARAWLPGFIPSAEKRITI